METGQTRIDPERSKAVLRATLLRLMPKPGDYPVSFCNLCLYRRDVSDAEHVPIVYEPVLIIIAQGEKNIRIGTEAQTYGDSSYFITGVDMPTACAVQGVSAAHPFLSLALPLDRSLIARLAMELPGELPGEGAGREANPDQAQTQAQPVSGAMIASLDAGLLDAVLRLTELVENPQHAAVLAPLIVREIHYRLLTGRFGAQLRSINQSGTPCNKIARCILWLRENYQRSFSIDELAQMAHMATSTFHKHFREVTAMSPLQFQKRLRLERAQQLMLTRNLDATQAALEVGYENPQQFGREYKRLFGDPPHRDIVKMRGRQSPA